MPDEITVTPKSEPESTPATETANQTISLGRAQLVNLCAVGLGISFFLPWANVLFGTLSGFDLQKLGNGYRLLWLIPIFCAITIFAGVTKRSQQIAARITGVLPFIALIYYFNKVGNDLMHMMTFGAYLTLGFGLALLVLPQKSK